MLDEDREVGSVSFNIYKSFFNYYGRFKFFIKFLLIFTVLHILGVALRFWVSVWSDSINEGETDQMYYLKVLSLLGFTIAIVATTVMRIIFA